MICLSLITDVHCSKQANNSHQMDKLFELVFFIPKHLWLYCRKLTGSDLFVEVSLTNTEERVFLLFKFFKYVCSLNAFKQRAKTTHSDYNIFLKPNLFCLWLVFCLKIKLSFFLKFQQLVWEFYILNLSRISNND
jgi:hypothetical protein